MAEALGTFLAAFVISLLTGLAAYVKTTRSSRIQRQYDQLRQEEIIKENLDLKQKIENLAAVVEDLRTQVNKLQPFKELYETLNEAHSLLKADHEALRRDFQEKVEAWNLVNGELEHERQRADALECEITELRTKLTLKENEIKTFEKVLTMLGIKIAEGDKDNGSE